MGATNYEIKKLEEILGKYKLHSVLEFGSQTNYTTAEQLKPPFMSEWYKERGIEHDSIDLAGDNNSKKLNWSKHLLVDKLYTLVTDWGSGEHSAQKESYISIPFHDGHINSIYPDGHPTKEEIERGFYTCWWNKHNFLGHEGIMFNVNPLTSHWENHCYSWIGENFYHEFVKIAGYELIETEIVCGAGNCESGKNVVGIIRKISYKFPLFEEFYNKLPIYKS